MARMLGRSYLWKRGTRWHKRREARQAGRELDRDPDLQAVIAEMTARGGIPSTRDYAWADRVLGVEPMEPGDVREALAGECRHGCNGSHVISGYADEVCDWQCHPGLEADPARAARHAELMGEG